MSVGIPSRVVMDRSWPLWRRNIAIVAIAVLTSLMLWLWTGTRLSRQLGELRDAAGRIAGGDLSPPPPVVGTLNREVGALQEAFVTMSENLRVTRDALDRQAAQERTMREMVESLQRQVVRQERLAAVGVLVSGIAHELNNPLQAILGGPSYSSAVPAARPTPSRKSRSSKRRAPARGRSFAAVALRPPADGTAVGGRSRRRRRRGRAASTHHGDRPDLAGRPDRAKRELPAISPSSSRSS